MEDFNDWLIGYRWRSRGWKLADPSESPLVTRCPQHSTRWAAEVIGMGHTIATINALEAAKERDNLRLEANPALGMNIPYMLTQVALNI